MKTKLICINCPRGCELTVTAGENQEYQVAGWSCKRGKEYAISELTHPVRVLTTTVSKADGTLAAVRTEGAIPKELLLPAMEQLRKLCLEADVDYGSCAVENILNTGINVIVTRV